VLLNKKPGIAGLDRLQTDLRLSGITVVASVDTSDGFFPVKLLQLAAPADDAKPARNAPAAVATIIVPTSIAVFVQEDA
jgi:hypothetical protein